MRLVVLLLPLVGLAGCAGLGGLRNVILSQEQLQTQIDRQFPRQQRLLELIDVNVAAADDSERRAGDRRAAEREPTPTIG